MAKHGNSTDAAATAASTGYLTRFQKGQSGNPKGRPRKSVAAKFASSYDVLDRELKMVSDGVEQKLSLEEGLQLKIYNAALNGDHQAQRTIMKMIAEREAALLAHERARAKKSGEVTRVIEPHDPKNAYDALLLLGVAKLDLRENWPPDEDGECRRLLLEPWAVQAAVDRLGNVKLSTSDLNDIRGCLSNPSAVDGPERQDRV